MENYGTGVGRIMNEYDDFVLKPMIELSENIFKITLPNRNYVEPNDEKNNFNNKSQEEIVIEYVKNNKK